MPYRTKEIDSDIASYEMNSLSAALRPNQLPPRRGTGFGEVFRDISRDDVFARAAREGGLEGVPRLSSFPFWLHLPELWLLRCGVWMCACSLHSALRTTSYWAAQVRPPSPHSGFCALVGIKGISRTQRRTWQHCARRLAPFFFVSLPAGVLLRSPMRCSHSTWVSREVSGG